jgi:m7GpppX diphosphatase
MVDQGSRRVTLYGTIASKPALLTIERHAFPSESDAIGSLLTTLVNIKNLEANDIYAWYIANIKPTIASPDVKLDLIYPCTEKHVKKYSPQTTRVVTETPEIYAKYVRPYIVKQRQEGKLNWVFNIIEGRKEQEAIILRESRNLGHDPEGFLLSPDMNWDRKTMSSLRLLVLVERRDLWSLRDLKREDVPWLKRVQSQVLQKVEELYGVEGDELKLYMHCRSSSHLCREAN